MPEHQERVSVAAWLRQHPTAALLGGFATMFGIAYAISGVIFENRLDRKDQRIDELERNLAVVQRSVRGAAVHDLTGMVVEPQRGDSGLAGREVDSEWRYYYRNLDGVTRTVASPCEVYRELRNDTCSRDSVRLHVFRWGDVWRLENVGMYDRVFPNILVSRERLVDLFDWATLDSVGVWSREEGDTTGYARMMEMLRDESIGRGFVEDMSRMFATQGRLTNNNLTIRLKTATKSGRFAHTQYELRFDSVAINGKWERRLYVTIEELLIADGEYIWRISTMVPSRDPLRASKDFATVSAWMSSFAILPDD